MSIGTALGLIQLDPSALERQDLDNIAQTLSALWLLRMLCVKL